MHEGDGTSGMPTLQKTEKYLTSETLKKQKRIFYPCFQGTEKL